MVDLMYCIGEEKQEAMDTKRNLRVSLGVFVIEQHLC